MNATSMHIISVQFNGCQKTISLRGPFATLCRGHHLHYNMATATAATTTTPCSAAAASSFANSSCSHSAADASATAVTGDPLLFISPVATAAAAAAQRSTMTVGTVALDMREKSPIISTANQVNAITTLKTRRNKKGDLVPSTKKGTLHNSQHLSLLHQGSADFSCETR